MNVIRIENAYHCKYGVEVLNAARQKWTKNDTFNCIGSPKKQHLLLCFLNCGAVYTTKEGKEISVSRNSVVYAPEGCEYKVRFTDFIEGERYNCIGINFKLYDEDGAAFRFDDNIKIYALRNPAAVFESFQRIAEEFRYAVHAPMRATGQLYILLSDIGSYYHERHNILPKYNIIAKGINALESTRANEIKVNELAKMCNVSPIYFRKLFKEYAGITPMEYKLNAMIAQAKQQLVYSDKPVREIADMLGFSSATYFCRIFKKKVGMTPMEYKDSQE